MSSTTASYISQGGGAYFHFLPTTTCSVGTGHGRSLFTQVPYGLIFWQSGQVTGPAALPLGRVSFGLGASLTAFCQWRVQPTCSTEWFPVATRRYSRACNAMIANARETKISAVQRVFPLMFTWSR